MITYINHKGGYAMKVKSVFQGDLTSKQQKAIELLAKAIREGKL